MSKGPPTPAPLKRPLQKEEVSGINILLLLLRLETRELLRGPVGPNPPTAEVLSL